MAGDKYKVKITNVGVGDPFILIKAEFADDGTPFDGGTWSLPSNPDQALENFTLHINFHLESGIYAFGGIVQSASLKTTGPYWFGLPFDQNNFQLGDSLGVVLTGSDDAGSEFYFYSGNQDSGSTSWDHQLSFHDAPKTFSNIMVYYDWAAD